MHEDDKAELKEQFEALADVGRYAMNEIRQSGMMKEVALLQREYYDQLCRCGFTADQAMQILLQMKPGELVRFQQ